MMMHKLNYNKNRYNKNRPALGRLGLVSTLGLSVAAALMVACQEDVSRSSRDGVVPVQTSHLSSADIVESTADPKDLMRVLDEDETLPATGGDEPAGQAQQPVAAEQVEKLTETPAAAQEPTADTDNTDTDTVAESSVATFRYTYKLPAKVKQLDVVMMINNSYSMKPVLAGLQAGLGAFMKSLATAATTHGVDMKVYMISCDDQHAASDTAKIQCMDFKAIAHSQLIRIRRQWSTSDSLYMLKIMQMMASSATDPLGRALQGRGDAKKMFIVVSDGAAYPTLEQSFITNMNKIFGRSKVIFSSLSSPRPTSIDMVLANDASGSERKPRQWMKEKARTWLPQAEAYFAGQTRQLGSRTFFYHKMCGGEMTYSHVYEFLAKYYRGKLYSICAQDWSQHFADLQGDISARLGRTLSLTELGDVSGLTYESVAIGGVNLSADEYTITKDQPPQLKLHTAKDAEVVVITATHNP